MSQITMAFVSCDRKVELYSGTMWEAGVGEASGMLIIGMWEALGRLTLLDLQCRQLTFTARWDGSEGKNLEG